MTKHMDHNPNSARLRYMSTNGVRKSRLTRYTAVAPTPARELRASLPGPGAEERFVVI